MQQLDRQPYPATGPWHFVSQAFGAYWTNDCAKGDEAIMGLQQLMASDANKPEAPGSPTEIEGGFHWQVFQIARILSLFGSNGVYAPHRMGPQAEEAAKELIWKWLEPRARLVLVEPSKDWWIWGSENHHLQAWFSMWGALNLFAKDPEYRDRQFADGSSVPQLKLAFDDYFKRWIRNRATRGLFVECGSPTYAAYSFSGFYNLVDFSDDPELRRLAKTFLDLAWTQWALEQMDGVRAGSRHRSYPGPASLLEGACDALAWYHFGIGDVKSAHPTVLCTATSSYVPPDFVNEIAHKRAQLGAYEITSRQPGLSDPAVFSATNFVNDPQYPFYVKRGIYTLDPQCRSMLRRTFATPEFILGTTMVAPLPQKAWTDISSQNRWDGVIFSGPHSPRIFLQPKPPAQGSIYNTEWSVQSQGVLLAQRLPFTNATTQRVWFSGSLQREEKKGWIFVEAPDAYAAVKVVDGAWSWEPDGPAYRHNGGRFIPVPGNWLAPENEFSPIILEVVPKSAYRNFAAFQNATLADRLTRSAHRVDFTSSFYHTTVSLFTDFKELPQIDGKAINLESPLSFDGGVLQSTFGGHEVKLHVFGQDHLFTF